MSALVQSPSRKENLQHESSLARSARTLIASTLVGLWTSSANANILLFSANVGDQNITGTQLLNLNGSNSGGTTLTFNTTQSNQRVSIIFDTTCFISSPNSWAIVKILVTPAGSSVPIVAPPTNAIANDGAFFCGGVAPNGTSVRASVVASVRPAIAGTNKIQVQVRTVTNSGPPPQVDLQASSLTVMY